MITLIAAVDLDWGIGKNGSIPWKLPEDMKRFREVTSGHTVLMGRTTYESIGSPLPKRRNIVLSSQPGLRIAKKDGLETADSFDKALAMCDPLDNTFVIGGEAIYRLFLPHADVLDLTFLNGRFDCDKVFPSKWENCKITSWNNGTCLTSKTGLKYFMGTYELSHSSQHSGHTEELIPAWNFNSRQTA